ncbi:MAG: NusA-like transcription termination signal-binding factor [Candidatus Aenigmatarchaeota archaeon]
MKVTFDTEAIKTISLFQSMTGANVKDCAETPDEMYFVVGEGEYGLAVGKDGSKVKHAEAVFKKPIKIFEYSPDLERFVRNLIPEAQSISIKERSVRVRLKPSDRAKVIGKGGTRVKVLAAFVARLHDVEDFKVV